MPQLLHHFSFTSAAGDSILRGSRTHGFVAIAVLSVVCLVSPSLLADSGLDSGLGGEGYGEGALLVSLETANITVAFLATMLFIAVARRLGSSPEGIGVGYIACGIALLGMTRVFYILADSGVLYIHDDTLEFWWHIIFFLAMAMCVCGGKVLSTIEGEGDRLSSLRSLKHWCVVSAVITAAVFLTAEPFDKSFVAGFDGTIWDTFGIQHFVAFVAAALALLHMVVSAYGEESSSGAGIVNRLKVPLMVTYGLFALDHFWELLTESWEIILLEEALIEQVEQVIVLPAFLAVFYAGWKLWARRPETQQASAAEAQS